MPAGFAAIGSGLDQVSRHGSAGSSSGAIRAAARRDRRRVDTRRQRADRHGDAGRAHRCQGVASRHRLRVLGVALPRLLLIGPRHSSPRRSFVRHGLRRGSTRRRPGAAHRLRQRGTRLSLERIFPLARSVPARRRGQHTLAPLDQGPAPPQALRRRYRPHLRTPIAIPLDTRLESIPGGRTRPGWSGMRTARDTCRAVARIQRLRPLRHPFTASTSSPSRKSAPTDLAPLAIAARL